MTDLAGPDPAHGPGDLLAGDLPLGSGMQELLEILAGQMHRELVRQYPEELWQVRQRRLPYEALPEDLKDVQRAEAKEALRLILAQGWRIEPPRTPEADLASYRERGEAYLKQGEPFLAYEVLTQGLKDWPGDLALVQLQALALIRSGAPEKARAMLQHLLEAGHRDQGTLAPLARAHRELGLQALGKAERRAHFQRAYELYRQAYEANRGMWSGIHAAILALLLDRPDEAAALATELRDFCLELPVGEDTGRDPFWVAAVLSQAAFILGDAYEGLARCAQAAEFGRGRAADLAELRASLLQILKHRREDPDPVARLMPLPRVVVFSGHMVDFADRREPRFPPALEPAVAEALRAKLDELQAESGFANASCGAALLFHEAMLARGAETHVVLPYDRAEFLADSVAIRPDMDWTGRFDAVLAQARRVVTASPRRLDAGSVAFQYANALLLGLACLRARQLHSEVVPLAVWDGVPSEVPGSTAWTVQKWKELGYPVELIGLPPDRPVTWESAVQTDTRPPMKPRPAPPLPGGLSSKVMVLLFADVVHFSHLDEPQLPAFVAHFLGALRDLEAALPNPPLMKNTWGDGLFMVFQGLGEAACFAQGLVDTMARTDWGSLGLPPELNLRVALHAGPVYVGEDPVTGRPTCFGTHVNRAARIEPITPPGQVYASQAFAALATAEDVPGLVCEYVGQLPLAKGFGTFPMYLMRVLD